MTENKDRAIYKAFQIAGAVICGVAGGAGAVFVLKNGLVGLKPYIALCGLAGFASISFLSRATQEDRFDRWPVRGMIMAKSGLILAAVPAAPVIITAAIGAVAGALAGSIIGAPVQLGANWLKNRRANSAPTP